MNSICTTYILRPVAALLLCVGVASCSQDVLDSGNGGELPSGEHPLKLTAAVEGIASRAAGKEMWNEDDAIAVKIYPSDPTISYPATGKYFLNPDGTVKRTENPLAWPEPSGSVKAWYPYIKEGEVRTESIADQTKGGEAYDYLIAESKNRKYTETVDLEFEHQMAKVSVELVRGEGISEEEWKTVKLSLGGYTEVSFSANDGVVGSVDGTITPNHDPELSTFEKPHYEALLVPRAMDSKPLIIVKLTVNVNGHLIDKTLTYTASSADDLVAGSHKHYTVTVQKDRLMVNPPVSASWNDEYGKSEDSKPWVFKVVIDEKLNIPKSRRKDMVFTNVVNEKAFRDSTVNYLEVAGNEFSITSEVGIEKTLSMRLDVAGSKDDLSESKDTVDNVDNIIVKYTYNFRLRSNEVKVVYKEFQALPSVGDFYYSDGTWSSTKYTDTDEKKCIGVVFQTIKSDWWNEDKMRENLVALNDSANYDFSKFKDGIVHGYVVAIKDASEGCAWSNNTTFKFGVINSDYKVDHNGYANTAKVIKTADSLNIEVPAFKACRAFESRVASPHSSSGWYLPSTAQFRSMFQSTTDTPTTTTNPTKVAQSLKDASPADYTNLTSKEYWSSLEHASQLKFAWYKNKTNNGMTSTGTKTNSYRVRAILTF